MKRLGLVEVTDYDAAVPSAKILLALIRQRDNTLQLGLAGPHLDRSGPFLAVCNPTRGASLQDMG